MSDRRFKYHRYETDLGRTMVDVRDDASGLLVMRFELPPGFEGLRPEDMPAVEEELRKALAKHKAGPS
jgi:hypothetical protein